MMRAQEDYNKELESTGFCSWKTTSTQFDDKIRTAVVSFDFTPERFPKRGFGCSRGSNPSRVVGIMYFCYFYQSICDYYYDDVGEKDEGEKEEKLLFFIMVNGESICRGGVPFISHIKCTTTEVADLCRLTQCCQLLS